MTSNFKKGDNLLNGLYSDRKFIMYLSTWIKLSPSGYTKMSQLDLNLDPNTKKLWLINQSTFTNRRVKAKVSESNVIMLAESIS